MLPKVATLSDTSSGLEKRGAKRRSLKFGYDAIERRGKTRVLILDLSTTGMRLQTSASFEIGEHIDLVIPEGGPVSATIVREARAEIGKEFGAEFETPITAAAVSAVLLAAPAFTAPIPREDAEQWLREAPSRYPEEYEMSGLLFAILMVLAALVVGGFVSAIGFLPVSAG